MALSSNTRSMRELSIVVEYNQAIIPSKDLAIGKIRGHAELCDTKSEDFTRLWSSLSITITTTLSERHSLIRKLRLSHKDEASSSWGRLLLDGPGFMWAIISTRLG